jgi:phosphoglycolate phosphatase
LIPVFPVYLFDIDGTLLDSAVDICGAVQQVISEAGFPSPPFEHLRSFIGLHLTDVFSDVFPNCDEAKMQSLIQSYRKAYPALNHRSTTIYPGVAETLAALPGRKSTATTKGSPMARSILEQFGLANHFEHIQGTDGFPCKPAPDVILTALRQLGADPADCLMIGDAPADIAAARAAGVKVCCVRWGYGNPAELASAKPDYFITDIGELTASI